MRCVPGAYVSCVGVVERLGGCGCSDTAALDSDGALKSGRSMLLPRFGGGEGVDIELVGTVERLPDVVNGVRSSTSGKCTRTLFFDAYVP